MPEGWIPVRIRLDMVLCLSDCDFAVLAVEVELVFGIGGGFERAAQSWEGHKTQAQQSLRL